MNTASPQFFFFANNLALDLVNTEFNDKGNLVDLLQSKADFFVWAQQADMGQVADDESVTLEEIKGFRGALRHLYRRHCDGIKPSEESVNTINQYLGFSLSSKQLMFDGTALQLMAKPGPVPLRQALGNIASSAAQMLGLPSKHPIKACANPDCMAMFVDTSKAKKRRWCVMEICGNRAKASAHYHKVKKAR